MLDSLWSGLIALNYDASFGFLKDSEPEICEKTYNDWLSIEKRQFSEFSTFSPSEINEIIMVLETFAISFVDLTPEKGQESCGLQVYMTDISEMDEIIEKIHENTNNKEIYQYLLSKKEILIELLSQRQ